MTTESTWRKSSHSANDGTCVELCGTLDQLRDSKHRSGPVLRGDVPALLRALQAGRIDL